MLEYRFWTRQECVEAVRALEEGISSGAASVSYPAGGSVAWTTLEKAAAIAKSLYARIDAIDGKRRCGEMRFIRMLPQRGW